MGLYVGGEEVRFKGEICIIIVGNFYCYLGQFLSERLDVRLSLFLS